MQNGSATPEYLTDDGHGNIASVTGNTQAVTCSVQYDPWGNPISGQGTGNPCPSGSTSGDVFYRSARRDASTGNYQFGCSEGRNSVAVELWVCPPLGPACDKRYATTVASHDARISGPRVGIRCQVLSRMEVDRSLYLDGNGDGNAAELWRHAMNYDERHSLKFSTQ